MKSKLNIPGTLQDIIFTVLGILSSGFALKSFLVPNNFLDGGVTGISLLIHELAHFNLSYVLVLANVPLILMGGFQVSWRFAYRSFATVVGLALCFAFIHYPVITTDTLLVSLFGGFFLGLGAGLCMRGGCALDSIEVLALYTLKRSSFSVSEIILGINVIIFLVAALHFGLEKALYSMLTYYAASRTLDYVVEGLEEYTGVTVISGKSDEIKRKLVMELGRGITVYKGKRGYLKNSFDISHDCDIIFTVITRLEVRKLTHLVHEVDPKAFVFTNTIKEAAGGVLKRKAGKH
ncbi:MAG: hypothetical protein BGO69_14445 [Bacteroidetes bacterium 46-16]|nr:MAG: hypothetical protein BGO69_14445 [Bacteroidetes bacterium 46-16]